jgi:predicted ATPase/DNA-binding CsgD family transcriptional regulator
MPAHVTHRLLGGNTMRTAETDLARSLDEPLTRREAQALALLAAGYSRSEIAAHLTLALSSVKFHIEHLYAKLGVNSKRQALSRARALGLLGPPPPAVLAGIPGGRAVGSGPAPRHNLPMQVTRFFGREAEMALLRERLDENRLVTLTGPGGVGKTRLSLRTAEELLPGFTDGVWLVELAPLSDPALVAQQVASSLGLRDDPGLPILETLTFYLRQRQVLLVLDNCEHLLEACGQLADTLLRAGPGLRILASSREPLGIAGEAVFSVPSLSFPDPDHMPPIDTLGDYVAINLLVDRARLMLADYQVTPANAASLARICQRLDGIPLAIEMAAARLNILQAEQLADRLDDAFRLLTGGSRSALLRQQTLRATVDWSYKLLSVKERLLLQRLSVFASGCTLEAAEAVCAGRSVEPSDVLDLLASLVARSMVIADRRPGEEPRYRMLEMVRQYSREKLQDSGESAALHTLHRDYFLVFAETNVPKLYSSDRLIWTQKLKTEYENLRLALEWSFSDLTDVDAGPRLVVALFSHLWNSARWSSNPEMLDWCERAISWCHSHPGVSAALIAQLQGQLSTLIILNDPHAALTWSQQAVETSRRLGPVGKEILVSNLLLLGWRYLIDLGDLENSLAPYAEAQTVFQELRSEEKLGMLEPQIVAWLAYVMAETAFSQGKFQEAKIHADESVRLYDATGDHWTGLRPRIVFGLACLQLREFEQARKHFWIARTLAADSMHWKLSDVMRLLGIVALRQGYLDEALEYCRESMQDALKWPMYIIVASCLGLCAAIAAKQGQAARAATLSGAAHALYAKQHRSAWEDSSLDTLLPGWREGPDAAGISQAFEAGQALNVEQAMAYALSECSA